MSKTIENQAHAGVLPLLPLRGLLAFPNTVLTLDLGRSRSVAALESALEGDKRLFVVAQRDAGVESPHLEDMHTVGTVVGVKQVLRLPDDSVRVLVEGQCRAILLGVEERGDMQRAEVMVLDQRPEDASEEETLARKAMMRAIREAAFRLEAARAERMSLSLIHI